MSPNTPSSRIKLQHPATWTREKLLAANLRVAMRITQSSREFIEKFVRHVVEKQLIKKLTILAVDRMTDEICGSLSLEIDWQKHEAMVKIKGEALRTLPMSFEHSGESIHVAELAGFLAEYARYFELKLNWNAQFAEGVNVDEARRLLGTVPSKPMQWKKGKARSGLAQVAELPELSVVLRVLEDPTGYKTPDSWETILSRLPKLESPRG